MRRRFSISPREPARSSSSASTGAVFLRYSATPSVPTLTRSLLPTWEMPARKLLWQRRQADDQELVDSHLAGRAARDQRQDACQVILGCFCAAPGCGGGGRSHSS